MIFVTVGSSLPFDRLIRAVDAAAPAVDDEFFAQIGDGTYEPTNFSFARLLDNEEFASRVEGADVVIGHAGMGTISTALAHGKALIAMPRLPEHGELVNDHQRATVRHFVADGHLLAADDETDLVALIEEARSFRPVPRVAQPEIIAAHIGDLLTSRADRS